MSVIEIPHAPHCTCETCRPDLPRHVNHAAARPTYRRPERVPAKTRCKLFESCGKASAHAGYCEGHLRERIRRLEKKRKKHQGVVKEIGLELADLRKKGKER